MEREPYLAIATTQPTPNEAEHAGSETTGILQRAQERFRFASDFESRRREQGLRDLRFRAGDQWEQWVVDQRTRLGRPCLTVNRIPQFLKQVVNDQRQNRPGVQINPVSSGADQDTAEIFEGMIRHIQTQSQADIAVDTAFEGMVTSGFGFFRVITRYVTPRTEFNDLELAIEWIPDAFSVYFDPEAMQADFSDASWAFIVSDMSRSEFKARWPKANLTSLDAFSGVGDQTTRLLWLPDGNVRVAEYYFVENGEKTICKLASGIEMYLEDVQEGQIVFSRRQAPARIVHHLIITATEILEHETWEGSSIPIVPVLGDEVRLEGERQYVGMVRYSYDAQRMYNFAYTSLIEAMALMPKSQYIAEATQIEGFETEWTESSNRPVTVMRYHAKSLFGQALAPPQRVTGATDLAPMIAALQQSDNNLKAVFGIYDASLGARGPQESGRAILARQRESDVANFNYIDNLSRSIRHCGRILVEMIPKIYDRPGRVVHIMRMDGSMKAVMLNQPYQQQGSGPIKPLGVEDLKAMEAAQQLDSAMLRFYDLRVGQYDVTVSSGPSYTTRRQEAAASMLELVKAFPQIMTVAGDQVVDQMDWPGARLIAGRLKKALPPELQDDDGSKVPPQIQAQLQQSQVMIQDLTKVVNTLQDKIDNKQLEVSAKKEMNSENNLTQIVIEGMRQESANAMEAQRQQHAKEIEAFKQESASHLTVFQTTMDHLIRRLELKADVEAAKAAPAPSVQ